MDGTIAVNQAVSTHPMQTVHMTLNGSIIYKILNSNEMSNLRLKRNGLVHMVQAIYRFDSIDGLFLGDHTPEEV